MPRRRWKLRDRRTPLREASRRYLELGPGGLQAYATKADRPDDYLEARYFTPAAERAAAWAAHGEEILAAWVLAHAGSRPWAWWHHDATEPRRCVEGAAYVWKPGSGDWVWRENFGIPGGPQLRRPGAMPDRLVFEAQASYLRRLNLLAPGELERLTADDFEVEIILIPEEPLLDRIDPRRVPAPALAPPNGRSRP